MAEIVRDYGCVLFQIFSCLVDLNNFEKYFSNHIIFLKFLKNDFSNAAPIPHSHQTKKIKIFNFFFKNTSNF